MKTIFKVPGVSGIHIPILEQVDGFFKVDPHTSKGKLTQDYTVTFAFPGINVTTVLFGYTYGFHRITREYSRTNFFPSAAMEFEVLYVIISIFQKSPLIEQSLNNGTLLPTITIKRYGWVEGKTTVLKEHIFGTNHFFHVVQILDYEVVGIRYNSLEIKVNAFDQEGKATGTTSSKVSSSTGVCEVK
ncbi:MAG: hypothetical protein LBF72_02730 [Holosporales bacterium]|jgi:hypothetical protein|nr:hypothetical protein [Holosporales bacterium]